VTVVVPTFNEQDNVAPLVAGLQTALEGWDADVLFVDDSSDETPDRVRHAATWSSLPVSLVHREPADRVGGLSGAVVVGLTRARGEHVVVMDGDLQHPPGTVPLLLAEAVSTGADLVVASRYCGSGGGADGLSGAHRRLVSSTSTLLTRSLFPRRVGGRCTDPMTGFFCVTRSAIDLGRLDPRGFKILLELLATHDLRVREVPFVFGERHAGRSKADLRQGMAFLRQLVDLRAGRMVRFGLVGATGFVLNLAVMAALVAADVNYVLAGFLATEAAIVSNFLLQERLVFGDRTGGAVRGRWRRRALQSVLFNNAESLLRIPLLVLLVEVLGAASLLAQALTLVLAFGGRFVFVSRVVYRPAAPLLVAPQRVDVVDVVELVEPEVPA
jgi:dolichol-phosphate mannosyltransferase